MSTSCVQLPTHGSRQFSTLEIWQSPDKFTGKRKTQISVYVYISPCLSDELLHSKKDEDTSGSADTDPKQRQAKLTISFRGRKVLLSVKSVVAGGVKEDGRGVAVDSPYIHRFIDHLIDPSVHPLIHPSINHSIDLSIDRSIPQSINRLIHRSMH